MRLRRSVPGMIVAGCYVAVALAFLVMGLMNPSGDGLLWASMPEILVVVAIFPPEAARSALWQVLFMPFVLLSIGLNALLLYLFCAYLEPEPSLRYPGAVSDRLFTAATPRMTIFLWGFVLCLFGGFAGFFINFAPFAGLLIPSAIVAMGATTYIALQWWLRVRSGSHPLLQSPLKLFLMCALMFGIVAFGLFLLLFVTLPAIATDLFGRPYRADDRVVKVQECRGRWCAFCKRHLELEKHDGYRFCLEADELPRLKAGDRIQVVGSSSSLGIRIRTFTTP